jgi:O-antigen/teichoic acid export membrane protein
VEQYGIWLTANALLSLLMVSDFGIGSGLINAVGAARTVGDNTTVRSLIATAYAAFGTLAIFLVIGVTLIGSTPLLSQWLGITQHPELWLPARQVFYALGFLVSSAAVLNVINFVALALQEGYLQYLAQIAASVASLILIFNLHSHSMSRFAIVSSLPIIAAYLLLSAYLFGFRYRSLMPTIRSVSMRSFRLMWKDSSQLLIAQIADTVIAFTSNVLVAAQLGAAHVPEISVSLQVMMIFSFVCCMFLMPLWPAYVEAGVRKDWYWIRKAFRRGVVRSMGLVLLATTAYTCIYQTFIHVWSPVLPIPPIEVVLGLDVWFIVYVWNKNLMVLLNGLGLTHVRAWAAPISAVLFVVTAHILLPHLGLVAVPIAGTISAVTEGVITSAWGYFVLHQSVPVRLEAAEVVSVPNS